MNVWKIKRIQNLNITANRVLMINSIFYVLYECMRKISELSLHQLNVLFSHLNVLNEYAIHVSLQLKSSV